MKKLEVKILGLFIITALAFAGTAFADESMDQVAKENAALKNQVSSLSGKVDALERQVSVLANSGAGKGTTYVPAASESGMLNGITVSGFVDTQYNNNFTAHTNNPNTTGGPGNPLRSFDNNQNTFTLNNVEFDVEKLANPEGGAGFRVDISAGEDMRAVNTANNSAAANSDFGFQQAYVQLVAPLHAFDGNDVFGNTVDIKAGRMVTLAGAEVIEGKDNWNISRNYIFGLALPFTHTGVRTTYKLFKDKVTLFAGLNNGWDNNVDNNTWKTWELGSSTNITDKLNYSNAIYFGPEGNQQAGHKRFLFSNVVSYQATDKLALKSELTFANQNRVPTNAGTAGVTYDTSHWWGWAGYVRYAMTEKWGMAYRFDYFHDMDRTRTGGTANSVTGHTLTTDYKIYDNLLGRVEYRLDNSHSDNPFNNHSTQSTLGAQLIYSFA